MFLSPLAIAKMRAALCLAGRSMGTQGKVAIPNITGDPAVTTVVVSQRPVHAHSARRI